MDPLELLKMIVEHCDRRTAEVMSHIVPAMAVDPTLQDKGVQAIMDQGAQVWNSEFAQIKAGLGSLAAQIPTITKTGSPTTPPVVPIIPPVIPVAATPPTTMPAPTPSATVASVSLQQLVTQLASQGLTAAALAAGGLKAS